MRCAPLTPAAPVPSWTWSAARTRSAATPGSSGPADAWSRPSSRPAKAGSRSGRSPRVTMPPRPIPLISPEGLTTVAQMLADRTITARIGSTADPDAAGQGLDQLRRGALRGKAVIRLQSPGAPAPHDPSGPAHRMDRRTRPAARWDSTGPGPARTGPRAGSAAIPRHPIAGHERVRTQSMTQQPAWTQMPLPNIHACRDGRPTMRTAFISSSSGLHAASWTCRTLRRQRHAALARGAGAFTGGRRSSVGRVGLFSAPSASLPPAAAAAAFFDRGNAGSSSAMARGCAWSCSIC
jgi:hypothetical protein